MKSQIVLILDSRDLVLLLLVQGRVCVRIVPILELLYFNLLIVVVLDNHPSSLASAEHCNDQKALCLHRLFELLDVILHVCLLYLEQLSVDLAD